MNTNRKTKVVIAGGGTAGWMAAAGLSRLIDNIDVVLVESDEIPTIGVGEATIPTLVYFHKLMKIDEAEFLRATQATFKLGINFEGWRNVDEDYFHAFGHTGKDCWAAGFQHFWRRGIQLGVASDFGDYCLERVTAKYNKFAHLPKNGLNYAYHIDAGLYAKYLRKISESHGCERVEGKIDEVCLNSESGFVEALILESGKKIEGDLFLDCTGQRALLIEGALKTGFQDWDSWLKNDRAIAVQTKSVGHPVPYTRSIAHPWGWQWRIPLQHRVGNGIVFSSQYVSEDEARNTLLSNIDGEPITDARLIKFRTGTRTKHWNKNCIAIGLSSGFLEPLESTSIHLIQESVLKLMRLFPHGQVRDCDVDEFNNQIADEIKRIKDFIILHYFVTNRSDSKYWQDCQAFEPPEELAHRIKLFKETGRVFLVNDELFQDSWMQVMIGQGLVPETYHPIVDNMSEQDLANFLNTIKMAERNKVSAMPEHFQYIQHYCSAEEVSSVTEPACASK